MIFVAKNYRIVKSPTMDEIWFEHVLISEAILTFYANFVELC